MWTVVGAPTGDADALDVRTTHCARLALATKQPGVIEIAVAMTSDVDEFREGHAEVIDRIAQYDADRLVQPAK